MGKEQLIAPGSRAFSDFERQYISLREKEQRLYTNDELRQLPQISSTHPHYREWQSRKRSSRMLIDYLRLKRKYLNILEVGCGNGWLSARMAELGNVEVTGTDINLVELEQAMEVFDAGNLHFVYGDIREECFTAQKFDVIVFAASIQYFPSLQEVVDAAFSFLSVGGEIHVMDSHFYKEDEIDEAHKRTADYYFSIGHPDMGTYYFHHCLDELQVFEHKIMFDPRKKTNRVFRKQLPFYWVCIKQ